MKKKINLEVLTENKQRQEINTRDTEKVKVNFVGRVIRHSDFIKNVFQGTILGKKGRVPSTKK